MNGRLPDSFEASSRVARIDLDRLVANLKAVRSFAARPVMPVIKADAYGHGAVHVARRLEREDAPMLAVALIEEGIELRAAGVRHPIVVLMCLSRIELRMLRRHGLTPVVSTPELARQVTETASSSELPESVHLKVDTGMGRLGLSPAEAIDVAGRLAKSGRVRLDGLMTHLASADEDPSFTNLQLDRFDAVIDDLARRGIKPRWIHAANSAGLAFLRPSHTLVRPGLLVYGVTPRPLAPAIKVQPVMSVGARIALIKDVAPGAPISYGGRWIAPRPSRIATVPLGYADGVPRTDAMMQHGRLVAGGRRVPVAGTVCMDMVMVDVSEAPDVRVSDEITLLGDEPDAWELAGWSGTNAYQVLTGISGRVTRQYIESGRVIGHASRFNAARSAAR